MKIPKTGSIPDKICKLLLDSGPQKFSDIIAAIVAKGHPEGAVESALNHMRTNMQLDHDGKCYLLSDSMRRYYNTNSPTAPYKGEIVPPRQAQTMENMTDGLSLKYQFWNAPRREPIRTDVPFKTGSTGFPVDYQS